ncbi:MAG: diacylglycerol/lipid kinase family protein [Oscillochloridaceae bacterium umkhey_bin13]
MDFHCVLVIINPIAGQHDPAATRTLIEQRFGLAQIAYEIRTTQAEGDALRWAQQADNDGFDLVVVSGGDGTIMEAMSGLIKGGSRVPLAQLPAGTANLLARALGIPTDQAEALETVFLGKPVPSPPLPTQLDGELLGTTPLEVETIPGGALLVVPQAYSKAEEVPTLARSA